ncbi:unnamed protein product [Tetraodon nigroviridis]|uniref:Valine--tRNA ligase, mitochondrial n=1 Tax=Tetraodon nigroviridis TaxID=99883 RepID=Q4SXD9_TETNG|nr:unnamed protein product [Tetraodon nigroviridis]
MWSVCFSPRLPGRAASRLCHSKAAKPSSSSSQSDPQRPKAEKQRRRREREEAVLTRQRNTSEDAVLKWSQKQKIAYSAHSSAGAKKDTSLPFPPSYSPEYVEPRWYEWWEKEGFFTPEQHDRSAHAVDQTFCLCIPPPNVTGTLHVGHALTVAVEDALVRWRRMQGQRVLWVPGCDHAGIATQTVVERKLRRETGKRRQDFSRQEFLQEVWKWKEEKGEQIYQQLRSLGASLDWSRACFTLDPIFPLCLQGFSGAVTEAFVRLCDAGLIYRAESLVNWSCALESAISDIEVDSRELPGPTLISVPGYETQVEFGRMFTFAYPLEGCGAFRDSWKDQPCCRSSADCLPAWSDGEVAVSTTRPETMLGDVAVAVHPDDPRYQAVHGKLCRHPFTHRLLPIITDTLVDMQLGTGAVKVTPAHDHTDFLLSQRHSLPRLTVIGGDGTMTAACGPWLQAVKRFQARQLVVEALVEKKLFRGHRGHSMSLPVCSRSGDVVEPLLRKQWFVRCQQMAQRAVQAVEEQQLRISPPFHTKTWRRWLSGARYVCPPVPPVSCAVSTDAPPLLGSDWCISRQLWWGHRIPAYRVKLPDWSEEQEELWVCGRSQEEARRRAADRCGVRPDAVTLTQDPDVLDTWFSSALFPFAMLGWPEQVLHLLLWSSASSCCGAAPPPVRFSPPSVSTQSADLQRFYPNSLLETGSDLIFFWVARMVMLGTQLTGQLPFRQVLLHPLVRDQHGRKMSKSLGNVIDPLDVIHGASLEVLQQKVKEGNVDPREQLVAMEAVRKDFPAGIPACSRVGVQAPGTFCSSGGGAESVLWGVSAGEDIRLSISQVLACRTFCNKMWQTLRFTLRVLAEGPTPLRTLEEVAEAAQGWRGRQTQLDRVCVCVCVWQTAPVSSMDQWICSRLYSTLLQCEQAFPAWDLHLVTAGLQAFWVHSLCDVYLEYIKPLLAHQRCSSGQMLRSVLFHCVSTSLALLSPFMPFITEELWQRLRPFQPGAATQTSLCLQPYPSTSQLRGPSAPPARPRSCTASDQPCGPWAGSPASTSAARTERALPPLLRLQEAWWVWWTTPAGFTLQLSGASPEARTQQLSLRRDKLLPKLQKVLLTVQCPDYRSKAPAHAREKMEAKMLRLQQELRSLEEQMKSLKEPPGALGDKGSCVSVGETGTRQLLVTQHPGSVQLTEPLRRRDEDRLRRKPLLFILLISAEAADQLLPFWSSEIQNIRPKKLIEQIQSHRAHPAPPPQAHPGAKAQGRVREAGRSTLATPPEVVIPILVIACDRVTVRRSLDRLIQYRPSPQLHPIIISQDCGHAETARVIGSYGDQVMHISQPDLSDIRVRPEHRKFQGYYKIARHYRWALNQVFGVLAYATVVIVEDDLEVGAQPRPLTRPCLPLTALSCSPRWPQTSLSISGPCTRCCARTPACGASPPGTITAGTPWWTRDGRTSCTGPISSPELGWMLLKETWEELEPKWPPAFWDDWMRQPEQRQGRSCVRPEVSRTITFGRRGVSLGQFFDQYLRYIRLNTHFVPFTQRDLSYLLKERYDGSFLEQVYAAAPAQDRGAAAGRDPGRPRALPGPVLQPGLLQSPGSQSGSDGRPEVGRPPHGLPGRGRLPAPRPSGVPGSPRRLDTVRPQLELRPPQRRCPSWG